MSTEKDVYEWIMVDNELKDLATKMQTLKERKQLLHIKIITAAKETDNMRTILESRKGNIRINEYKTYSPLTIKYVEARLQELIQNPSHAKSILDYLKRKRDIKSFLEIKRL